MFCVAFAKKLLRKLSISISISVKLSIIDVDVEVSVITNRRVKKLRQSTLTFSIFCHLQYLNDPISLSLLLVEAIIMTK